MVDKPAGKEFSESGFLHFGNSWAQVPVGGGVIEMIPKGKAYVAVSLNYSRAEVLITVSDNELGVVANCFQSRTLVREEVGLNSFASEVFLEASFKL